MTAATVDGDEASMAALVEVIIQVLRTLPLCLSKAMMLAFC